MGKSNHDTCEKLKKGLTAIRDAVQTLKSDMSQVKLGKRKSNNEINKDGFGAAADQY